MTRVIRIGFFRELRHGDPQGPSLRDAVSAEPGLDEARVAAYLRAGEAFIMSPGVVTDILDPSAGIIGSGSVLTDGTHAWPDDLAHYVERHHARLPAEFVEYAASQGWRVPSGIDPTTLEL